MRRWLKSSGWLVCWFGVWWLLLTRYHHWMLLGFVCLIGAFMSWCHTTVRVLSGAYTPVRYQPPQAAAPRIRRVILEETSPDDPTVIRRVILEEEES